MVDEAKFKVEKTTAKDQVDEAAKYLCKKFNIESSRINAKGLSVLFRNRGFEENTNRVELNTKKASASEIVAKVNGVADKLSSSVGGASSDLKGGIDPIFESFINRIDKAEMGVIQRVTGKIAEAETEKTMSLAKGVVSEAMKVGSKRKRSDEMGNNNVAKKLNEGVSR